MPDKRKPYRLFYWPEPDQAAGLIVNVLPNGERWKLLLRGTDFVSMVNAAGLIGVSVMTVSSWLRGKGRLEAVTMCKIVKRRRGRPIMLPFVLVVALRRLEGSPEEPEGWARPGLSRLSDAELGARQIAADQAGRPRLADQYRREVVRRALDPDK